MIDLAAALMQCHGVMSTAELLSAGATRHQLDVALQHGRLVRVRNGWYSLPDQPLSDPAIAKLLGGSLTCVSALAHHGIWVPSRPQHRHVRLSKRLAASWPDSALHARLGRTVQAHRQPSAWRSTSAFLIDSPTTALLLADRCVQPIELVAIVDSLRYHGIALTQIEQAAAFGTAGLRTAIGRSRDSESGYESIVRERLRGVGITARSQVWVGRWRLDLVIGKWLVIEVDGFAYHADRVPFDRDRLRDRELALAGFTVLRLTVIDVEQRWDEVLQQIRAAMSRGWHRRPRRGAIAG